MPVFWSCVVNFWLCLCIFLFWFCDFFLGLCVNLFWPQLFRYEELGAETSPIDAKSNSESIPHSAHTQKPDPDRNLGKKAPSSSTVLFRFLPVCVVFPWVLISTRPRCSVVPERYRPHHQVGWR